MIKSFAFLLCLLSIFSLGVIPATAGTPDSYTPWSTPYTGTELWYCSRGGADGSCNVANIFTYPGPIGAGTPNTGAFTTLSASGAVSGAGFTNLFAVPPPIGSTTPNTGAFTILSASGAVSGNGFINLFAAPPPIGNTTPNTGTFTNLAASGTVSGAGFTNLNTAQFAAPPPIGSTTPNTGAFTNLNITGTAIYQGYVDINNQGADGTTLFSTVGYGFPPTKSGFFTSGLNSPSLRYISVWFAQTAIYATTTRDSTMGETGLYITWSDVTGYSPIGSGGKSKAAVQVSGDCGSGGGACWDAAMSLQFDSGWAGASGNFGSVLELDPENNSGGTVPAGGATSEIFGLWVAGQIGTNPISSMIQISPAGLNGAVFAAHYGINIGGATVADTADINTGSHAVNGYVDTGVHSGYAFVLQGTYTTSGMTITGTTPTGISIISVNISTTDINVATHATNSYVDGGTHSGSAAVYQGIYSTAVINITGASPTGINLGVAATATDINDISHATNGYVDTGTHSGYAFVMQGSYSTAAMTITGTTPTGINISGTNISTQDINLNTHATNGFVDSGTHTYAIVLQGTYAQAGILTTGIIDFHYAGTTTCTVTGSIAVQINAVAHKIPYC